jgi:hypothetical protein
LRCCGKSVKRGRAGKVLRPEKVIRCLLILQMAMV